jgi:flagellar protein FlaG
MVESVKATGVRIPVHSTQAITRVERERQDVSRGGKESPVSRPAPDALQRASEVAEVLAGYLEKLSRDLTFRVDDNTGDVVVTVLNSDTGEVVRQLPSEERLAIARYLAQALPENSPGVLLDSES